MRAILTSIVIFLALQSCAPVASANPYADLLREFDARFLTEADKRFLQTSLAFEGDYIGMLDGEWGGLSQRGLEHYARREFATEPQDWHMAILAWELYLRIQDDGWRIRFYRPMNISMLVPSKTMVSDAPTEVFVNWHHRNSSLAYSITVADQDTAQRLHDYTEKRHLSREPIYSVRRGNLAVTKAKSSDGSILYTRSDFTNGAWSTVMLSANRSDAATLNAVAASIEVGQSAPLNYTTNGRLFRAIETLATALETEETQPTKPPSTEARVRGSGSGFVVSNEGHVLTNSHVVDRCEAILVDGRPARLLDASEGFDLALLQVGFENEKAVAVFSSAPARLNSDVTIVGYPLAGLLGGVNVTRGAVSSLKGIQGDVSQMQITAPIQPGNSGGPVIGPNGEVVGVVVATLDAEKVADVTGNIPQNVNFAVSGEIAKLFLSQNGVMPAVGRAEQTLGPVALAELATEFTAFVECR